MKNLPKIKIIGVTAFPFSDLVSTDFLKSKGVIFTKNPLVADFILTSSPNSKKFKLAKQLFFLKKYVVWTNEPKDDLTIPKSDKSRGLTMNVYCGKVFLNNLHFLGSYHYDFQNNLGIDIINPDVEYMTLDSYYKKTKLCVAVFAYKDPKGSSMYYNGEDISLNKCRQDIATHFYNKGQADIVGGGWPSNIKVLEESGFDMGHTCWWLRKIEILKKYQFNICMENTRFPYYCTEKIWHSIVGGCVPIYYGKGTNIYETFTRDSFVDASDFDSPESLLTYLEKMSPSEYVERYNRCVDILMISCKKKLGMPKYKTEIVETFLRELNSRC